MTDESLAEAVRAEWNVEGEDVVIEVFSFMIGGLLGGTGFQVALVDWPLERKAKWYVGLVFFGILVLGMIRVWKSLTRGVVRYLE